MAMLAGAALVTLLAALPPRAEGDAMDYALMLEAFVRHGTPDVRLDDRAALRREMAAAGLGYHETPAFPRSRLGPSFGIHFWLYPLCAVPARLLLRALHGPVTAALPVTNGLVLCAALGMVLFGWRAPPRQRVALALLAGGSPVLLYLRWMSHEVFTFGAVLIALVLIGNRRHGLAAAAAAAGALQNPPVGAVALAALALALHERRPRAVLAAALGCAPMLISPAFYLACYGVPNLINATGMATLHAVSLWRTRSLLFDLNQGLLPNVPGTLLLAIVGAARAARRRDLSSLLALAAAIVVSVGIEAGVNWNGAAAGLTRYEVWLLPLLAWIAVAQLPSGGAAAAVLAAAGQLGIAALQGDSGAGTLRLSPLASYVLRHAPRCYDPEPEIFSERQLHADWLIRPPLPIAFPGRDGEVTKVLVDGATLPLVPACFETQESWWRTVRRPRGAGPFYLEPPPGALRLPPPPRARAIARSLGLVLRGVRYRPGQTSIVVELALRNTGRRPLWGAMYGDRLLGLHAFVGPATALARPAGAPQALPLLRPGATELTGMRVILPVVPGRYLCIIRPEVSGLPPFPNAVALRLEIDGGGAPPRVAIVDGAWPPEPPLQAGPR